MPTLVPLARVIAWCALSFFGGMMVANAIWMILRPSANLTVPRKEPVMANQNPNSPLPPLMTGPLGDLIDRVNQKLQVAMGACAGNAEGETAIAEVAQMLREYYRSQKSTVDPSGCYLHLAAKCLACGKDLQWLNWHAEARELSLFRTVGCLNGDCRACSRKWRMNLLTGAAERLTP